MWPTVGRTYHLHEAVQGLRIAASITLNHAVGGFRPDVVESAALQDARVLFMPTWSAMNDLKRGGFSRTLRDYIRTAPPADSSEGLTVLDQQNRLKKEVEEVLAVAREYDMIVFTGHLSPRESIALAESGLAQGRLIFSHPDSHSVGATREDIVLMARLGAYVEICALGIRPEIGRITPAQLAEIIEECSPERCVITSDYFFHWSPPSSVLIQDLVRSLMNHGIEEAAIRQMVCRNPSSLLGWGREQELDGGFPSDQDRSSSASGR
jgi:hypothetical protein